MSLNLCGSNNRYFIPLHYTLHPLMFFLIFVFFFLSQILGYVVLAVSSVVLIILVGMHDCLSGKSYDSTNVLLEYSRQKESGNLGGLKRHLLKKHQQGRKGRLHFWQRNSPPTTPKLSKTALSTVFIYSPSSCSKPEFLCSVEHKRRYFEECE